MKLPSIEALSALVEALKLSIEGDTGPSMDLTIGCDPETGAWSWQTGDNSFTGGAYGYPIWGVAAIDWRSNAKKVACDLIDQIADQASQ